jgi:hypothetical protein
MKKKQQRKQKKREQKLLSLLTQNQQALQKAEQKTARAQAQLVARQRRLFELETQVAQLHIAQNEQAQEAITSNQSHTSVQQPFNIPTEEHGNDHQPLQPMPEIMPPQKQGEKGLYAYALLEKTPAHLDIIGVDKEHSVYAIADNDMCVVVSEIDIAQFQEMMNNLYNELTASAGAIQHETGQLLQAHEAVIDVLMQQPTVIPLKFGTILKDEMAAHTMLHDQGETFKHLLSRLHGMQEWGVKVYADMEMVMKEIAQQEAESTHSKQERAVLSQGASYLLARKKEESQKDLATTKFNQISETVFHELSKGASEAKLNTTTLPQKSAGKKKAIILNALYLLDRNQVDHFRQQGKRLMENYNAMGVELEFSGPWPPYNFT